MQDRLADVGSALDRLVGLGRAAPLTGITALTLRTATLRVDAMTRPAFWGPDQPPVPNIDNLLVCETHVRNEPALVLAVAHGNYKDPGSAYASAAAVVAIASELESPLLGEADVSPALQRAILAAHDRIQDLHEVSLPEGREIQTAGGTRRNLAGIGASVAIVIATRNYAWVAHVGDNHALLVHAEGESRRLTLAHVLANDPKLLAKLDGGTERAERAIVREIVLQIVGCGRQPRIDVSRVPVSSGARLVLGNAALDAVARADRASEAYACNRLGDAMSAAVPYLPATLAVATLA